MSYSFGTDIPWGQFEEVEVYAYYDIPLSSLLYLPSNDSYYMVNVNRMEHVEDGLVTEEIMTLLNEAMLDALRKEKTTIRQIMVDGIQTENLKVTQKDDGNAVTCEIHILTEQMLMDDILQDENRFNTL